MKKTLTLYFLLCMCCLFCTSQISHAQNWTNATKEEVAKEFEVINSWCRNTPAYSMIVTHTSYEDHTTTIPYETMSGYFKKENNNYHSYLLGIHTIQNAKYRVVVDTSNKIILIATAYNSFEEVPGIGDFEKKLDMCVALKKSGTALEKRYRLEFDKSASISSFEIAIYPQGMPKEVVVYYNTEMKKEESDPNSIKVKPRAVISFTNYKTNIKFNYKEEFSESNYVTVNKDKKIVVNERFKGYEFSDQRVED